MTLLITVFAAIIASLLWFNQIKTHGKDSMKYSTLCYMFWGASLMWLVDAIAEYAELGAEYFTPAAADMLNDAFLGVSVVALALVIWLARLLWSARGLCRAHSA